MLSFQESHLFILKSECTLHKFDYLGTIPVPPSTPVFSRTIATAVFIIVAITCGELFPRILDEEISYEKLKLHMFDQA